MKLTIKIISGILACMMLASCAGEGNKQTAGALIGAGAGGLVGSRFGKGEGRLLATGIGAVAGALIGGQIGKSLDDKDRQLLALSSQKAFETSPSGRTTEWHNPDSGHHGSIVPREAYQNNRGQYCREYTQEVVVGGQVETAYGTACRQPDGQWKIVK